MRAQSSEQNSREPKFEGKLKFDNTKRDRYDLML